MFKIMSFSWTAAILHVFKNVLLENEFFLRFRQSEKQMWNYFNIVYSLQINISKEDFLTGRKVGGLKVSVK